MSTFGIFRTILATQLAEAVKKDGPENAARIADGKFGPAATAFLNDTAKDFAEASKN